jgi:hypothetical protein
MYRAPLTLSEHPFVSSKCPAHDNDVGFNHQSLVNMAPPLVAFAYMNLYKLPRPFVVILCCYLAYHNNAPYINMSIAIVLATALFLYDNQFQLAVLKVSNANMHH